MARLADCHSSLDRLQWVDGSSAPNTGTRRNRNCSSGVHVARTSPALDPDKVVANYASDGVLLPTVSNKPRTNPAEIRDYFVKFLKSGPQGKIDTRIIKIGCNVAQDVGTYTFKFKDGKTVHARYTYVYEWQNGSWLIAHHHSSAMPEAR
jgi:uncharacterized protein (TIGR02246 family)